MSASEREPDREPWPSMVASTRWATPTDPPWRIATLARRGAQEERRRRGEPVGDRPLTRAYWSAVWARYLVVRWLETLPFVPFVRPLVHREVIVLVWSAPFRRTWWLRSAVATHIGAGNGSLAPLRAFLDEEARKAGVRELRLTAFHPRLVQIYEGLGYSVISRGRGNRTRMRRVLRADGASPQS